MGEIVGGIIVFVLFIQFIRFIVWIIKSIFRAIFGGSNTPSGGSYNNASGLPPFAFKLTKDQDSSEDAFRISIKGY